MLASTKSAHPSASANYIEDVFSTYLYTGNGSTQTITNGIDLSGKGGLVWSKRRDTGTTPPVAANYHTLFDTARTLDKALGSNDTSAEYTASIFSSFNANGYTLNGGSNPNNTNPTPGNYVSWTFRKQPKFFDIVTYTGNGTSKTITHNLGSTPACIITKRTDFGSNWLVYHRSIPTQNIYLNKLDAAAGTMGITSIGSTTYAVNGSSELNEINGTYVAYIFAHNAGGFGATGTDNVISCGSYTGTGAAGNNITLGYEPQWLLIKGANFGTAWQIYDNMRGITTGGNDAVLYPNLSDAEDNTSGQLSLTATGFEMTGNTNLNASGKTYIYIAIRRPMKTPTTGTEVFSPISSSSSTGTVLTTNFPVDMQLIGLQQIGFNKFLSDRLRGVNTIASNNSPFLDSTSTSAEISSTNYTLNWNNTGFQMPGYYGGGILSVFWNFKRAAGFFDVVCYSGNDVSGRTLNHNLTVAPELMIVKIRNGAGNWSVYAAPRGATEVSYLNNTYGFFGDAGSWANTAPTASVFSVGANGDVNATNQTYVAYLFATVAGVSKVGSYTGTGATLNINAGFTTGARFVMIKRTDANGYNWFVWDTARGMVSGTDPKLALNTTDAESNANWVYTASSGFQIVTTDASVNANGGSYIYLAIS